MSKEVADCFVEALRKLEENEDVEALVEIHTGDCEVGNVSVPGIFRRGGIREDQRVGSLEPTGPRQSCL